MTNMPKRTIQEAYASIVKTILYARIAGLVTDLDTEAISANWNGYVGWQRSFSVEARISVRTFARESPDDFFLDFFVSWSATSRSPAAAIAAASLYREVAELACLLEAQWGGVPLARK